MKRLIVLALLLHQPAIAQPVWHPYWRDKDVVLLINLASIQWKGKVATVETTWTATDVWTGGGGVQGEAHEVTVDCAKYATTKDDMRALWSEICLRYLHTGRTYER